MLQPRATLRARFLLLPLSLLVTFALPPDRRGAIRAAPNAAGPVFSQVKTLAAADGADGDEFGSAVALDGDTLVVGVRRADPRRSNQGAVYVFARHAGGAENWGLVKKLTASDAAARDGFGVAVALSGTTLVVGADGDNISSSGGSNSNQGSAYVFERDAGGAGNWGEVKKLVAADGARNDHFGIAVALGGGTIIVGANGAKVGEKEDQGAAYVFERDAGGAGKWGEVQKLTSPDGAADDEFGVAVAVGDQIALVGADRHDVGRSSNQGAAYVFARDAAAGGWQSVRKLVASDGAASDNFGGAVAVSGATAVVGACCNDVNRVTNQGAAYVFERGAGGPGDWAQVKKLTGLGSERSAQFGFAVAVAGDLIAVGAKFDDGEAGADQGMAYVFGRDEGGVRWGLVKALADVGGSADDEFGGAVAVGSDTVVAGAAMKDAGGEDRGAVVVFTAFAAPLLPEHLFSGTVGADYFQPLSFGGPAPTAFAVTEGSLPRGLLLNRTTGLISGVPEATGKSVFTVRATGADGAVSVSAYAVNVHCPLMALGPARLPDARVVRPYRAAVSVLTTPPSATPYTFKIIGGGLPTGLALDAATGVIAGTPKFVGNYRFTVEARDLYGCADSRTYTLRVSF